MMAALWGLVRANPSRWAAGGVAVALVIALGVSRCQRDEARQVAAAAESNAQAAQAVIRADREAARAVEPQRRRFEAEQREIERKVADAATSDAVGPGVQSYFDGLRAAREAGDPASADGEANLRR